MTYVIVEKDGQETTAVDVENKQEAEKIVTEILNGLNHMLNPMYLSLSKIEDDTIVRYDDKKIATIKIREDDEVDVSFTNEQ